MTKISKLILGAGALGVLGITALPIASYAVDVVTSVTVVAQDDTTGATGGNDPDGYTWKVADKSGSNSNNLSTTGSDGASTGGLAPATTASAYSAASTTAKYAVQLIPEADTVTTLTGTSTTYLAISATAQTIGQTTGAGTIKGWPTSVAVQPAAGTYYGTTTESAGSDVGLTAQWSSSLAAGSYKNTITISQTAN